LRLTLKKYLIYVLALPLIIPAIVWGLVEILPSDSFLFQNNILGDIGAALLMSLIVGGVPYVIFLIVTAIFYRNKSGRQLLEYCYFSPLIFYGIIMICGVFYLLYDIITKGFDSSIWVLQNFFSAAVIYGIYTLLIGYTYVGFAILVLFTFRKFGFIISKDAKKNLQYNKAH
jgi:hypothetical protein